MEPGHGGRVDVACGLPTDGHDLQSSREQVLERVRLAVPDDGRSASVGRAVQWWLTVEFQFAGTVRDPGQTAENDPLTSREGAARPAAAAAPVAPSRRPLRERWVRAVPVR